MADAFFTGASAIVFCNVFLRGAYFFAQYNGAPNESKRRYVLSKELSDPSKKLTWCEKTLGVEDEKPSRVS